MVGAILNLCIEVRGQRWPGFDKYVSSQKHHRGVWLATADGLLVSRDNGFQFERVGQGFFTGKDIHKIAFGPCRWSRVGIDCARFVGDPGRRRQLAGRLFWAYPVGHTQPVADIAHPGSFLIATTAEVLRFGEVASKSIPPEKFAEYRRETYESGAEPDRRPAPCAETGGCV